MTQKFDNNDGRLRGRGLQKRRLRLWSKSPHCAKCGVLTNYPDGFHLDHKNPVFKAGEDLKDDAVQVLCLPCHDVKTRADLGQVERAQIGVDGWPVLPCK